MGEVMRSELFEQEFTKQKNNCIQAFKAMGEENRLIYVLNEIEREKLTYKAYFKVGYECRQGEIDELQNDKAVLIKTIADNQAWCLELQKRVDAVQALAERWRGYKGLDIKEIGLRNCARELEQALKGGSDASN